MRQNIRFFRLPLAALMVGVGLLGTGGAQAASGTWTGGAGLWAATGNWQGGNVADGVDFTADFSTLNLAADTTVSLNGARTIGNLTFGDTTPSHNWTLDPGTGGALTLDVTTGLPAITVTNQTTTISAQLGGTDGLAKNGPGTLVLSNNANTLTGPIVINAGTVIAATSAVTKTNSVFGPINTPARTFTINAGAILDFRNNDILGSEGDGYYPTGSITLNGGQLKSTGAFVSALPALNLNAGTVTAGPGANIFLESWSFKGPVVVSGSAPSLINTTGTAADNNGIHLAANPASGGNSFDVANATGNAAVDLEVSARLVDAFNFGAFGRVPSGFHKLGAGTMQLSNTANAYTGTTAVDAGTLLLGNGSISGSPVTVASGAVFGGSGSFKNLTLSGGATVSPSDPLTPGLGLGILTASGDITLAGTSHFDLLKSGSTLSADLLNSDTKIVFGGLLDISFSGSALASGDTFNLFDSPSLSGGSFSGMNLPTLTGLSWDTSKLTVDGTIKVVPEPGSALLLLGGLATAAGLRRRRA